jgi:membrane-associated protease RseP (regulator of RpoE activity)
VIAEPSVAPFLSQWRHFELGERVIVEGLVARQHEGPSPELRAALDGWPGYHYWLPPGRDGQWLVLVREPGPSRERWWLHVLLLAVTLVTTSLAGAALVGGGPSWWPLDWREVARGTPFSLPLLAILAAHEAGHYAAARRYRVDASPPYFLPFFPPQLNVIGTLGAFIRLRSPLFDRRTLFDVGAAGPLAGVALALPVLVVGLALSEASLNAPRVPLAHQFVVVGGEPLFLGDSLVVWLVRLAVAPEGVLHLHPAAVAGWVGVFVTMLNLLPLGQLDGGHVLFALAGRHQATIARLFWLLLVALGWQLWRGWWVWAVIAVALGRGSLAHPRVLSAEHRLDPPRRRLAWAVIALFALCFMPRPIAL